MKDPMNVGELSRRRPLLKVSHKTSVSEAIEMMLKNRMTAICVMRREQLVGIFTMSDVMKRVLGFKVTSIWRRHERRKIKDVAIAEIMTDDPVTVSSTTALYDALVIMKEKKVRHLPVLADGELVGVLTLTDLAGALGGKKKQKKKASTPQHERLDSMYRRNLLLAPARIRQ